MTQPVQEPTNQRSISGLKWRTNQLERRPAQAAAVQIPILWVRARTTSAVARAAGSPTVWYDDFDEVFMDSDTDYLSYDGTTNQPVISGPGVYRLASRVNISSGTGHTWGSALSYDIAGASTPTGHFYRWDDNNAFGSFPFISVKVMKTGTGTDNQLPLQLNTAQWHINSLLYVATVPSPVNLQIGIGGVQNSSGSNVASDFHYEVSVTRIGSVQSAGSSPPYIGT